MNKKGLREPKTAQKRSGDLFRYPNGYSPVEGLTQQLEYLDSLSEQEIIEEFGTKEHWRGNRKNAQELLDGWRADKKRKKTSTVSPVARVKAVIAGETSEALREPADKLRRGLQGIFGGEKSTEELDRLASQIKNKKNARKLSELRNVKPGQRAKIEALLNSAFPESDTKVRGRSPKVRSGTRMND